MPKLDLRRLILLLSMSATSLVLAYFLYASYQMQRELLIKQTLEANRIYAVKLAEVTENFLNTAHKQLAYSASVIGPRLNTAEHLNGEVDRLLLQTNTFNSVYIVNTESKLLARAPRNHQAEDSLIDNPGSYSALASQQPSIVQAYSAPHGRLIVAMTHPLHTAQGDYLGYIGGAIYLQENNSLHDLLGEHYYRDGSYLYVVHDRQLIYHNKQERVGEIIHGNPAIHEVSQGREGNQLLTNSEGIEMLAGFAPVQSTGWGIVAQRPLQATLTELNKLMLNMLLTLVPFFLAVMLAIWWLSRIISQPLWSLAKSVQKDDARIAENAVRQIKPWYFEVAQLKQSILSGLEMLNHRIGKLNLDSMTDPLTELLNRRGAQAAIDKWHVSGQPFAVILLDIDHFKQVNDAHGHDIGDLTLQFLARQMRRLSGNENVLCRSGGEEFMMLMPDTGLKEAGEFAENLRATLASTRSPAGEPITLSLGVAHYPISNARIEMVLRSADQALYQAKRQGRNQVVIAAAQRS